MSDGTLDKRGIESDGPWPSFALPHGTVVNGYRIERVLGSGGFGITYLAFDLLQQRFAIKEYYPRQFATRQHMTVQPTSREDAKLFEECRERFLREAQALVHLGRVADASDGIVRVKTYFEALGTCFLVMDYVEGDSLAGVFRDEPGGLSPARVRSLVTQLLSSIRVVHRAGLVHRDIKPANVILREDDRLVLIDFGSTRPGDAQREHELHADLFRRLRTTRADDGLPPGGVLRHLRDRGGVLPGDRRQRGGRVGTTELARGGPTGPTAVGRLDWCGTLPEIIAGSDRCGTAVDPGRSGRRPPMRCSSSRA